MKQWIKYGLLNALFGLLVVGIIAFYATGKEYLIFAIAVPIAAFLAGSLFWSLILNKPSNQTNEQIILVGFLTGSVSHFFTFLLLSIGVNLCNWTTGNCTNRLGEPAASVLSALEGAFVFCFFYLNRLWLDNSTSINYIWAIIKKEH